MAFLLRVLVNGVAIWFATLVLSGMEVAGSGSTAQTVGIYLLVGLVFGIVNAVVKPVLQVLSIPLYILTLGLISLVVNGLLLWITAWLTQSWGWGLGVADFWLGVVAAFLISVINWIFGILLRPQLKKR